MRASSLISSARRTVPDLRAHVRIAPSRRASKVSPTNQLASFSRHYVLLRTTCSIVLGGQQKYARRVRITASASGKQRVRVGAFFRDKLRNFTILAARRIFQSADRSVRLRTALLQAAQKESDFVTAEAYTAMRHLSRKALFMTDPSLEIILHNYPQSPVAEKARIALGIKKLAWRSVEIPRLAPQTDAHEADGRVQAHPCNANRRGHLLRHALHSARA